MPLDGSECYSADGCSAGICSQGSCTGVAPLPCGPNTINCPCSSGNGANGTCSDAGQCGEGVGGVGVGWGTGSRACPELSFGCCSSVCAAPGMLQCTCLVAVAFPGQA